MFCTKDEKTWILEYLSSGKGIIPYELVSAFDSLSLVLDEEFFKPHLFYSSMKDSVLSDKDYENVKKFYVTLKLSYLGETNQIYNFQDTIILCEIFEQRSQIFKKTFKFNPRKCNSASLFGGCVHRDKNKCCIALPTDAEHGRAFEKILIGAFSCVNTRLAFDTEILMSDCNTEKFLFNFDIDGKKTNKTYLIQNFKDG